MAPRRLAGAPSFRALATRGAERIYNVWRGAETFGERAPLFRESSVVWRRSCVVSRELRRLADKIPRNVAALSNFSPNVAALELRRLAELKTRKLELRDNLRKNISSLDFPNPQRLERYVGQERKRGADFRRT